MLPQGHRNGRPVGRQPARHPTEPALSSPAHPDGRPDQWSGRGRDGACTTLFPPSLPPSPRLSLAALPCACADMPETIAEIVRASFLPMSIVIVGVGKEDFGAMKVLDADDTPLEAGGVQMDSDIVQFGRLQVE